MAGKAGNMTNWLETHMLSCPSKKLTSIDCPGCGMQRSIIAILKGDITASWQIYPPTGFVLLTLILLGMHLVINERITLTLLKFSFIITVIVITVNYIYKIVNHQLI